MKISILGVLLVLVGSVLAGAVETTDFAVILPSEEQTSQDIPIQGDAVVAIKMTPEPKQLLDEQPEQERYYVVGYTHTSPKIIAKTQATLQKQLTLIGYIPEHQYIAKATEERLQKLQEEGYVTTYTLYSSWPKHYQLPKDEETIYYVYAFPDADFSTIRSQLAALDVPVLDRKEYVFVVDLSQVATPLDNIVPRLFSIEGVESVEPKPHYQLFNDITNTVVGTKDLRQRFGLYGEGQIIAIADTGLDTGKNDFTMHQDFQGRILNITDLAEPSGPCQGTNNPDDKRGHGTHVTGSAVGNGKLSGSNPVLHQYDGSYAGAAPEAKLIFQAIGCDENGIGSAVPVPISTKLYLPAYQQGARVHSNSYGGLRDGGYYYAEKDGDAFVNQYKDMLLVFGAGNSAAGPTTTTNNVKNGLTIGGVWRDQPNTQIYSRGPTKDGRYKPDILTPAIDVIAPTNFGITSTKSSVQQPYPIGCKDWSTSPYYCGMAGTSMATPNAAGSVAVLREYVMKKRNMPNPSAALVKALYLNGGETLSNGLPDPNYGFGRANLKNSIPPININPLVYYDLSLFDERAGLTTTAKKTYTLPIHTNKPFRLTLVWTDKEACSEPICAGTLPKLVNDLDLVITSPTGKQYNGNDNIYPFNNDWDRRNNVERVEIPVPESGFYTVEISGYNVPFGPQDFALVATYENLNLRPCLVNSLYVC